MQVEVHLILEENSFNIYITYTDDTQIFSHYVYCNRSITGRNYGSQMHFIGNVIKENLATNSKKPYIITLYFVNTISLGIIELYYQEIIFFKASQFDTGLKTGWSLSFYAEFKTK